MAVILRLVPYSVRDTITVLRALLARALRGEIIGLAVSFRDRGGREMTVFTGPYDDPGVAAAAALRMSMQMTRLQDERLP